MKIMKAIILAAGMSSRLMELTDDKPKCMLEIGGKTILQRQCDVIRQCGIDDIIVVRGYMKEKIDYAGLKYIYNRNYRRNNILESLMCAESEMDSNIIVSYSDILFDKSVMEKLLENKADISLVVDTDWRAHYIGRYQHPIEEAEKVVVRDGRIIKIGKMINPNETYGEFIGLGKFSKVGVQILRENYARVKMEFGNAPFHEATSLEKAYLTDMIQELIDRGYTIVNVDIKGGWMEIDTPEDLERAAEKYKRTI